MRKEERWRAEGMDFCIRFLEKNNNDVDALREELKRRGAYHTPVWLSKSEEAEFCHRVKACCLDTILIMTIAVLHDNFGFGTKRVNRFKEAFNNAAELLADDCINWTEIQQGIQEQLGMETTIRWNGKGEAT